MRRRGAHDGEPAKGDHGVPMIIPRFCHP
jgi:hypothetical protein